MVFDPDSLAIVQITKTGSYNYYRGDQIDKSRNNVFMPGHLSDTAMHLYGSADGTSAL